MTKAQQLRTLLAIVDCVPAGAVRGDVELLANRRAAWPKDRTREMFQEWFDVQMCPVIEDLHVMKSWSSSTS